MCVVRGLVLRAARDSLGSCSLAAHLPANLSMWSLSMRWSALRPWATEAPVLWAALETLSGYHCCGDDNEFEPLACALLDTLPATPEHVAVLAAAAFALELDLRDGWAMLQAADLLTARLLHYARMQPPV